MDILIRRTENKMIVECTKDRLWGTGTALYECKCFIRPVARVGSGDPVRVLRLYTTITLDEVCSIYC